MDAHSPLPEPYIQPFTVLQLWLESLPSERESVLQMQLNLPLVLLPMSLFLLYRKEIAPPDMWKSMEPPALWKTRQGPALLA